MAPEYAVMGHLSVKLDVYSFGVLVLEIVTGRRNTDACFESEVDEGSSTMLSYVSSRPSLPLDSNEIQQDHGNNNMGCQIKSILCCCMPGMGSLVQGNGAGDHGSSAGHPRE